MSLYFSGKDAYNNGNYKIAQQYFQEALVKDENIEAKAQNIKYMLGVSAFNNKDFKTAKTYLSLYENNPIANDLLEKIKEYEKTLPEDFLYYTDNNHIPLATSTKADFNQNTVKKDDETTNKTTMIIIITTTLIIMALSIIFEIKNSVFSKIALKLVGVSSNSIILPAKNETKNNEKAQTENKDDIDNSVTDISTVSLLETPFDEEIDIEKMASKDIKEISRFFDEEFSESIENNQISNENKNTFNEKSHERRLNHNDSVRNSILNSIKDAEEQIDNEDQETDFNTEESLQIEQKNAFQKEDISKKPKYEHLDNIPDDFNVNKAIERAFKLIEDSNNILLKANDGENTEADGFKSIEELENEMEEKEKINLNYFQEMDELNDETLKSFFNYEFSQYFEKRKQ